MKRKKKYRRENLMVVYQMMEASYQISAISAERMREFDALERILYEEPD